MLVFVVPVFEGMFEDLGGELPLPTKVLVVPVGGDAVHAAGA